MTYRIKTMSGVNGEDLSLSDEYAVGADIENPHAIVVRSERLDTGDFPGLLAVVRAGASVKNITVSKATEAGVCVFNAPGANANAVTERVLTALLGISGNTREVRRFMAKVKEEVVCKKITSDEELKMRIERGKLEFKGFELRGKTLGVIGLGHIGCSVANAARGIGMNVVGHDPYPTNENMHRLDASVKLAQSLPIVVATADMLTVHVTYSDDTRYLINREVLKKAKKGIILLNYSLWDIYDDEAVCEALEDGRVFKYMTDFPTIRLVTREDTICTPHIGANTEEAEENCAEMAAAQLKNYLEYGIIENSVNFPAVDLFPAPSIVTRLVVINKNVPDMIARITSVLGRAEINITTELNQSQKIGYTLIDLETKVSPEIIQAIREIDGVIRARALTFS